MRPPLIEATLRFAAHFYPAHFLKTLISINGGIRKSGVLWRVAGLTRQGGVYRDETSGFAGVVDCCMCNYRCQNVSLS
jgi:hypothetical protein